MKYCVKCKNKDTPVCTPCDNGSLWEDSESSFSLIVSGIMFGCGMGGVLVAFYSLF